MSRQKRFDMRQGFSGRPLINRKRHKRDLRPADILLGTILHQTKRSVRHISAYVEAMEPNPGFPSPGPLAAACPNLPHAAARLLR